MTSLYNQWNHLNNIKTVREEGEGGGTSLPFGDDGAKRAGWDSCWMRHKLRAPIGGPEGNKGKGFGGRRGCEGGDWDVLSADARIPNWVAPRHLQTAKGWLGAKGSLFHSVTQLRGSDMEPPPTLEIRLYSAGRKRCRKRLPRTREARASLQRPANESLGPSLCTATRNSLSGSSGSQENK